MTNVQCTEVSNHKQFEERDQRLACPQSSVSYLYIGVWSMIEVDLVDSKAWDPRHRLEATQLKRWVVLDSEAMALRWLTYWLLLKSQLVALSQVTRTQWLLNLSAEGKKQFVYTRLASFVHFNLQHMTRGWMLTWCHICQSLAWVPNLSESTRLRHIWVALLYYDVSAFIHHGGILLISSTELQVMCLSWCRPFQSDSKCICMRRRDMPLNGLWSISTPHPSRIIGTLRLCGYSIFFSYLLYFSRAWSLTVNLRAVIDQGGGASA